MYTGPGGMQEHLNHLRDLRYSYSFDGNPSSAHGGFCHPLQGACIGLYPELSDVILLSSVQPMSKVQRCGHGGGTWEAPPLKTNAIQTGVGKLVDGYVPHSLQ